MMNHVRLSLVAASVVILAGCDWFKKKEESVGGPVVRIVNVLEKKYYDDAHITGSIQVDFAKVTDEAAHWNKADTIVFYCSNYQCQASFDAARRVKELGFENVMAYEGGMAEWYQLNKKGDPTFAYEGPATEGFLQAEVAKPGHVESSVKVITAQELKELMQQAGLLPKSVEATPEAVKA